MEYLNEAQTLVDEFNSYFPINVKHSGGQYTCNDFSELEECDSGAGELWANFLDDKGFGADFSLEELERCGDDLILQMYVRQNLESYVNGNITEALSNFETMLQDCVYDDFIGFLKSEISEPSQFETILIKLLEANY